MNMTAIGSYCNFYNAVPWGGYKILVIDVLSSSGTHTCTQYDTIELSPYFTTIDGAIAFVGTGAGNFYACTWSTTSLVMPQANVVIALVIGH